MISFKTFLTEARMAPLYHSTRWAAIEDIMKKGIEPRTIQSIVKLYGWNKGGIMRTGVSTTRNLGFAKAWNGGGPIIELDQQKLTQNYKIVPFQYWSSTTREMEKVKNYGSYHNEYEEFIITDKRIDPKYFKHVYVPESVLIPGPWTVNERIIIENIRRNFGTSFIRTY